MGTKEKKVSTIEELAQEIKKKLSKEAVSKLVDVTAGVIETTESDLVVGDAILREISPEELEKAEKGEEETLNDVLLELVFDYGDHIEFWGTNCSDNQLNIKFPGENGGQYRLTCEKITNEDEKWGNWNS